METKDSNGTVVNDGDSIKPMKDLKVKGSQLVLKRSTIVKNIKLTDDPLIVEGRVKGQHLDLEVKKFKKV